MTAQLRRGNSFESLSGRESTHKKITSDNTQECEVFGPNNNTLHPVPAKYHSAELRPEWWKTKNFPPRLKLFSRFHYAAQLCEVLLDTKHDVYVRGCALALLKPWFDEGDIRKTCGAGSAVATYMVDIFKEFVEVDINVIAVYHSSDSPLPLISYMFTSIASILKTNMVECWEFVRTHVCATGFHSLFVHKAASYLPIVPESKAVFKQLAMENIWTFQLYAKSFTSEVDDDVLRYYLLPPSRPAYLPFDNPLPQSSVLTVILQNSLSAHVNCLIGLTSKWHYNESINNSVWKSIFISLLRREGFTWPDTQPEVSYKKKYENYVISSDWHYARMRIVMRAVKHVGRPSVLFDLNNGHKLFKDFKFDYNDIMASGTPDDYARFINECTWMDNGMVEMVHMTLVVKVWHRGHPCMLDWLIRNYPIYQSSAKPDTIKYLFFQRGSEFINVIKGGKLSDSFMSALQADNEFSSEVFKHEQFSTIFLSAIRLVDNWILYDVIRLLRYIPNDTARVKCMYEKLMKSYQLELNVSLIIELGKVKEGYKKLMTFRKEHNPTLNSHMSAYEQAIKGSPYCHKDCTIS